MADEPGETPDGEAGPTGEDVYDGMEPFEPYTTGELTSLVDASKDVIRTLLEKLASEGKIRKKAPESAGLIWIREPPVRACEQCGHSFEVKYLHSVLTSVRFCPRCGARL